VALEKLLVATETERVVLIRYSAQTPLREAVAVVRLETLLDLTVAQAVVAALGVAAVAQVEQETLRPNLHLRGATEGLVDQAHPTTVEVVVVAQTLLVRLEQRPRAAMVGLEQHLALLEPQ
jgi:predicted transcriptional regulator